MSKSFRITIASFVAATTLGGCATAFKGKTTPVNVTSATPGAEVYVDGKQAGVTPMTVNLSNKTDAVITVHHADHEETCRLASSASFSWFAVDALLTGGIGIVVDWATHGWNNLESNTCHVNV